MLQLPDRPSTYLPPPFVPHSIFVLNASVVGMQLNGDDGLYSGTPRQAGSTVVLFAFLDTFTQTAIPIQVLYLDVVDPSSSQVWLRDNA